MGKKKELKDKMAKLGERIAKTERRLAKDQKRYQKLDARLEKLKVKRKSKTAESSEADNSKDEEKTEVTEEKVGDDQCSAIDLLKQWVRSYPSDVAILVSIVVIVIGAYATWTHYNPRPKGIAKYFAMVDYFGDDYYDNVTEAQAVKEMHYFDFKRYLKAHDAPIFPITSLSFHEVDTTVMGESLSMGYFVDTGLSSKSPYVSIRTRILQPDDTHESVYAVSYMSLSYYVEDSDGDEVRKAFYTPYEEIDLSEAVYDAKSSFFCGRKTFRIMVALFESGRLKKDPNGPLVGLFDEAAPVDEQSDLLREFHAREYYNKLENNDD